MPLDESLVSVLSLIITGVSVVLVPITVYLGLKQPIFLREAKKDLFLDFLSSYHKSARNTIYYIFGKKLNLKIIKISVFIGTVYYFLIIVTSLIWSSLSAKTSNIFSFSKLQAKYSELELSNINIIVIMIVYWSFHYLWVNMTEKDVKEDVRAKKIKEIRDSQLNVIVLTKYSRINGIIWDFFDKYLILRDDTGFISIPWDEIVWIKAK